MTEYLVKLVASHINPAIISTFQVHQAYQRQGVFFTYLMNCHELWEQADSLVAKGNHTGKLTPVCYFFVALYLKLNYTFFLFCPISIIVLILDFFIELDHENGPITLHSSLNNVVKYVQAGIQKLRRNVNM